jgi:hypothetical protein
MNPKLALTVLMIITVIWALVIVPCGALGLATVFLADGHPNPDAFALIFFGSLSFPVAIVIFTPLAWVAYFFKKYSVALILSLLPLPTLILPILGFSML